MTEATSTSAVPAVTRLLLGMAGLGLIVAGFIMVFWGSDDAGGGVLVRVGLVLGAAWLVAPAIRRPSLATIGLLVAGSAVLFRPRLIVAVAIAAVMWRLAQRRN